MQIELKNPATTRAFGKWLSTRLAAGMVISLEGPLGAGKTTMIQGAAQGLKIPQQLTSPTFILFRLLPVSAKNRARIKWLVHADAYRIKKPAEIFDAGLDDYLHDPSTVTIIEWGDKLAGYYVPHLVRIKIKMGAGQKTRKVIFPEKILGVPSERDLAVVHGPKPL